MVWLSVCLQTKLLWFESHKGSVPLTFFGCFDWYLYAKCILFPASSSLFFTSSAGTRSKYFVVDEGNLGKPKMFCNLN